MQRRDVLKTAGGIGAVSIAGGAGILATSSAVAATDQALSIDDPAVARTDDGSYQFVDIAYWKHLEWEGFDEEVAQFDLVSELTTDEREGFHELYRTEERDLVEAADEFMGSADYTSGPGTRGYANFAIGDAFYNWDPDADVSKQGQDTRWRVIAHPDFYDEGSGEWDDGYDYGLPENPLVTDAFEAREDGGENTTTVTLRVTFRLRDGSGNLLTGSGGVPHPRPQGTFDVTVGNIPASTSPEGDGNSSVGTNDEKSD